MIRKLVFLAAILWGVTTHAEARKILILYPAQYAKPVVMRVAKNAEKLLGVKIVPTLKRLKLAQAESMYSDTLLAQYTSVIDAHGQLGTPTILLAPAFMLGPIPVYGGMAEICGHRAVATFHRDKGRRWRQSEITLAHEMGHIFGAKHKETGSIMHPNPVAISILQQFVSDPTIQSDIDACSPVI